MKVSRAWLAALLAAMLMVAAGCGSPGESNDDVAQQNEEAANQNAEETDIASLGDVTLTVWDQEVRGGQRKQITTLNQAFMDKYPNVKIERVAKSFEDLNKTLKLAVSDDDAPDVVEANQGRPIMGTLVKAGLLAPLDPYVDQYGWDDRYSELLLDLNKFTSDGDTFGDGNLYGLSQVGEIVGIFYNKDKVKTPPATFEEFEQSLAEAKDEGDIPIQFGNLDRFGGIHNYETVLARMADKQDVRDFVFAREDASFESPGFEEAAAKLQEWAKEGYFTPDFNGVGYDPAWQDFAKGKGRYLIAGTWLVADLDEQMGDNVGFMLLPGMEEDAEPTALGGEGLPFAITSKSENPEVAAAYIDFITNPDAAVTLAETGNLPAMEVDESAIPDGLPAEVFEMWGTLNEADGLIPYLDYTTPTFYDDISAAVQELLAEKQSPAEFVSGIQKVFDEFRSSL